MMDLGITTLDVLIAVTTSPAFIFSAMGLCVAGAFVLLICVVMGGNK